MVTRNVIVIGVICSLGGLAFGFSSTAVEWMQVDAEKRESDYDVLLKQIKNLRTALDSCQPIPSDKEYYSDKLQDAIIELGIIGDMDKAEKLTKDGSQFVNHCEDFFPEITFEIQESIINSNTYTIKDNFHKLALDEQLTQTESDIYDHIDTVVVSTLELKNNLKYLYDVGPTVYNSSDSSTPAEFIEKMKMHRSHPELFGNEFQTTPISQYGYVMEYDNSCEFVAYSYPDSMKRHDSIGNEIDNREQFCDSINESDLFITDLYSSTGATDYIFAVTQNLDLDDDGRSDLIVSTAVNLVGFSEEIQKNIHKEDVRFILADIEGQIVFDCTKDACLNYDKYAVEQIKKGEFNKDSKLLTYDFENFPEYSKVQEIELENKKLDSHSLNSELLDGWILHVLTSEN